MKRSVLVGAVFAAAAVMAPMADAQDAKWDIGVYGRINWLDGAYDAETGGGLGACVGYLFNPWLDLQGNLSYSHNTLKSTTGYVNCLPIHVRRATSRRSSTTRWTNRPAPRRRSVREPPRARETAPAWSPAWPARPLRRWRTV